MSSSPISNGVPSAFVTVPNSGISVTVIVRVSPSGSTGGFNPRGVSDWFSMTLISPLSATGGLFSGSTGLTVPVTAPVSSPPLPSCTTYSNSIGPV